MIAPLVLACAHAPAPAPEPGVPVLPAPEAQVYTAAAGRHGDPWVVHAMAGAHLVESLSGAAGRLAAEAAAGRPVDGSLARWAAWRAGWPHPIDGWEVTVVPPGELPPWAGRPQPGPVGVARARGRLGEAWARVLGRQEVGLGPVPLAWPAGSSLEVPIPDPRGWSELAVQAVDPDGRLLHGPVLLDLPGLWLVEVLGRDPQGRRRAAAAFPIAVGGPFPDAAPFPPSAGPPPGEEVALEEVDALLADARASFGAPPPRPDPLLDAAARHALRRMAAGQPLPPLAERAAALGLEPGSIHELACTGETVADCFSAWSWSSWNRQGLLDPAASLYGRAARPVPDGVQVHLLLAAE